MPPNKQRSPGGAATPTRATNANQDAKYTLIVEPGADSRHTSAQTAIPLRYPVAFVSLYAPHAGRRTWWFAHVCVWCGYGHQGQLRKAVDEASAVEILQGARRTRCGRPAWFVVSRTYRGQSEVTA